MRNNTLRILVIGVTLALTLPAVGASKQSPRIDYSVREKICAAYTYSSCPDFCYRECIPSLCTPAGGCTCDCEGPGSCSYDPTRKGGGDS